MTKFFPLVMRRLSQKILVIAVGAFAFTRICYSADFSTDPISTVNFFSWTPKSFVEIYLGRKHKRRVFAFGTLVLPNNSELNGRVPAVVMLHGSGGDSDRRRIRLARVLAEKDIASFFVETFESRILYKQQGYLSRLRKSFVNAQLADAYAALIVLRKHPVIDGDRIALAGFSMGGISSYLATNRRVANALASEDARFMAHVAYYAPCSVRYETMQTTGAPILMFIGKQDESTPVADCERLAADLRSAGSEVTLVTFDTAAHGWDHLPPREFHPELPNPAQCRFKIGDDGIVYEARTGLSATDVPAIVDVFEACSSSGYTLGSDKPATEASDQILSEFLKQVIENSR